MGKTNKSSEEIAMGILATIEACKDTVAAYASGALSAPYLKLGTRGADIRFAPCFRRGMDMESSGVLYTTGSIANYWVSQYDKDVRRTINGGRRVPGKWIKLAMLILEGIEEGWVDEEQMLTNIRDMRVGYRLNPLLKSLREKSKTFHKDNSEWISYQRYHNSHHSVRKLPSVSTQKSSPLYPVRQSSGLGRSKNRVSKSLNASLYQTLMSTKIT